MKRRISAVLLIFLIVFSTGYPVYAAGTDEGYGEDETSLGQFVDSFENIDNVSVAIEVIRNSTLNAMELNASVEAGYNGFPYFIEFDIDFNRIGSNLSSFPVLLNISDSAGISGDDVTAIFDRIGENYLKIAITNSSMLAEYYVEVEYWNATREIAYLWFSPDVSSLENSTFRLHYGPLHANNTAHVGLSGSVVASNVWDANFKLVYHMRDLPDNAHTIDSTSNDNDGTKTGANEPLLTETGPIDGAQIFDGNDDNIWVTDDASISITGELLLEAWFKHPGISGIEDYIMGKNAAFKGYFLRMNSNGKLVILVGTTVGGNQEDGAVTTNTFDDNVVHYVAGVSPSDGSTGCQIYVDSVDETNHIGVTVSGISNAVGNLGIGISLRSAFRWEDILDEIRISDSKRSFDWINATEYSGRDNLMHWRIEQTRGFSSFGYFTTVDYLSDPLANGSALTALFNSSIPANTLILVEFSEDNSTWVFNDWDPLFGGFEAVDLRDLNYSAGFYFRYNLSTPSPTVTPRVYQSRLITTLGNVSAGAPGQNVTGEWIEYRASAINASKGVVDGGDLNSTFEIDGDTFNVSEVVGAPGMLLSVNFTGIDPDAECVWVSIWYLYDGNLNHVFEIEMWNFTSSAWVTDGLLVDTAVFVWANSTIYALRIPDEFLSGGDLRVQLNHETPGNINHDLFIDYIRLIAKVPSDVVAAEELFQFFWIVLAIALTMIILMIAKMWFEAGDP